MNKKRALHIVNSFDVGGMENGLVNLVNYSDNSIICHAVCALCGIGRAGALINQKTTKLFLLTNDSGKVNRTIFIDIYKVIKKVKPDIIHIRHWGPLWDTTIAHLLTFRRSRLVFSYHGKTYHEYCSRNKVTSFKRKILLRFIDQVVTLNEDMLVTLRNEERIAGPITVIPNGVDTKKFSPSLLKKELKKQLNLPSGKLLFGTVGRLSKIKDIATIIRASNLMKKKKKDFAVFIIGDGAENKTLAKSIKDYDVGDVVFLLGGKHNVHQYLKCFDVYIQASLYEGFSNTILEAISSGLPAIVSRVGGNPDLVRKGENGFLFSPGDDETLASQMAELADDKTMRNTFSLNSREMAVSRWSIVKMIDGYEKFYLNCLGRN